MRSLLVIFSIQFSVLFSVIGFANNAQAEMLWSVDEIYHLGEVLHSSRYDYEEGMEISFKRYSLLRKESGIKSEQSECYEYSVEEIFHDVAKAVRNHRSFYYDEEFDFDSSLKVLSDKLSQIRGVKKCYEGAKQVFYSDSNEFVVSYKFL